MDLANGPRYRSWRGAQRRRDVAQGGWHAFAGLAKPRGKFSSHTHAKQIYSPIGNDPHDDAGYHLRHRCTQPRLVDRVYQTLQEDRFGDAAKAAREARRAGETHDHPVREYPNLAIQKMGRHQPHNISQLNSERHGDNYLLASVPPVPKSVDVKPRTAWTRQSGGLARAETRTLAAQLRRFQESDPARKIATRTRRDDLVNALIDELIQLPPSGRHAGCGMERRRRVQPACRPLRWLDPDGADMNAEDATERVAGDFANWLNGQLRDPLPMGDPEYLYWCKLAREQFKQEETGGCV